MEKYWNADELIAEAEAATGLSDWGDEPFRDGLDVLVHSFNTESIPQFAPTDEGIARDRRDLLLKLEERLKLIDWRKREPGIAAEEIKAPIFVAGMARSGTTHTHRLLLNDPEARFAAHWEVLYPSPPPERATYETDPRIMKAEAWMREGGLSDDNFGVMHEYGAKLSDECQHIFEYTCRSTYQTARIQKPAFWRWLDECDIRPAYRFQKMLLQHLQYRHKGAYWLLKSPQHVQHLAEILEVFPDSRIIVTHRDPRQVLPSLVSIMATLQRLGMTRIDPEGEFDKWLTYLPKAMDDAERLRTDPRYAERFVHVHFDDLTADPVGTVADVRERLGLGFDDAMKARVEAYMVENPRHKKGEHKYSLEQYGLDPARMETAFADYIGRLDGYRRMVSA